MCAFIHIHTKCVIKVTFGVSKMVLSLERGHFASSEVENDSIIYDSSGRMQLPPCITHIIADKPSKSEGNKFYRAHNSNPSISLLR